MEYKLSVLIGKGRGQSFCLEQGKEYTVGRHSENDIRIVDDNISRTHFKIQVKGNRYFITDLHSKNGTFVDGRDLSPGVETEVREGVPIVIGMTILGLGEDCELCLKPFLDSAGFSGKIGEDADLAESDRVMAMKKNMEFIYSVDSSLKESKDLNEMSQNVVNNVFNLFKRVDRCVIALVDPETGKIENIIYRSRKPVDDPEKLYNRELVEKALVMNKPVMVNDSSIPEDEDARVTESLQLMKIRSAICVPITSPYSVRGVIYIDSLERSNGFRTSDAALLKDVSGRIALAMDTLSLLE
jgi:pSer/pThr/pTyr-binding forkhead associated (FHA) protein